MLITPAHLLCPSCWDTADLSPQNHLTTCSILRWKQWTLGMPWNVPSMLAMPVHCRPISSRSTPDLETHLQIRMSLRLAGSSNPIKLFCLSVVHSCAGHAVVGNCISCICAAIHLGHSMQHSVSTKPAGARIVCLESAAHCKCNSSSLLSIRVGIQSRLPSMQHRLDYSLAQVTS